MQVVDLEHDAREQLIAAEACSDDALEAEVRWMLAAMAPSGTLGLPLTALATADLSGGDAEAAVPSH